MVKLVSEVADPYPVEVEASWITKMDEPLPAQELASIRESVNRQRLFGETTGRPKLQVYSDLKVPCARAADP
jgi:hypothetical protein